MLRLSVSDNGCGISQDDIHHIFKRFYRSRRSSDHTGVGLGLYYFLFLCGIALVLLLFSILMTWQHTRQVQELLLEREATLASSLLEQGVSAELVAVAMKSDSISTNGLTFLAQIGHTSATPLPLSPLARQTAISFGILACVVLFLLGFAVLVGSAMYLHRQDALYQT